jgi:hypothetical protein
MTLGVSWFGTPQVIAKMKKTHTDLIHTIEMDMTMEGFSPASLQPLKDHKEQYEQKGGSWFNNSDNYKKATNAVIDAKLEICAGVLKSNDASDEEHDRAARMLFNENDSAALAKGITTILPHAHLLQRYGTELDKAAEAGGSLVRLNLENCKYDGESPPVEESMCSSPL